MGTATVMALGFLAIITIGAVLLMLPISSASGEFTSPLTVHRRQRDLRDGTCGG